MVESMPSTLQVKSACMKREFILLGVIALIALILRLSFLHEPFDRDEGGYAYIGQEILRGAIPYKDVIDLKPPGIYYIYAIAIGLFGNATESIRIFTAICSLITLSSVYWLARYIHGVVAGGIAALLYALYSCAPMAEGSGSNAEVFMVIPLVLGVCLFLMGVEKSDRTLLFGSGIFAGLAMLIKTVALPYVALLFVSLFFIKRNNLHQIARTLDAASFITPIVIMAGLTLGFFCYQGALDEFIYWNVTLPIAYSQGDVVKGMPFFESIRTIVPELLLLGIVAIPTAIWLLVVRRNFKEILIALLLPAACLGVWMPGKNFQHYFIQLYPFLALLTGVCLAKLIEKKGLLLCIACPVMLISLFYYFYKDYKYFLVLSPEQVSIDKFGAVFVDSVAIAEYIKKRTVPSDNIFQLGFEPELYFLTDRRSAVPHISTAILRVEKNRWIASLLMTKTIKRKKPKYIIIQKEWADIPFGDAFEKMLAREYQLEISIGYGDIYIRRQSV